MWHPGNRNSTTGRTQPEQDRQQDQNHHQPQPGAHHLPVQPTLENPFDVDTMLARELQDLSYYDRNIIQEEIHGVTSMAPSPSPQQIDEALHQLQVEVDRIPSPHRRGYEVAVALRSHYVLHDRDFRIKFLRADLFNARAAAGRFTKQLDLLLDFFGVQALLRPLRLDDLSKAERDYMKLGNNQVLPSRDRAGRLVVFSHRPGVYGPFTNLVSATEDVLFAFVFLGYPVHWPLPISVGKYTHGALAHRPFGF
jgi:hypothetical protein